ncbi:MAG: hypothetical protein JXR97_08570 [Planctomycetes bacterium]|nr:hypothetical protein [Planctomycetota bacterium]
MRVRWHHVPILAAIAFSLCAFTVIRCEDRGQPAQRFADLIAARPPVDIEQFNNTIDVEAMNNDAFMDILWLRDHPNAKALPALQKVMQRYSTTTYIYGFASAQAIHAIDSEASRGLLERHLLSPSYSAAQSIGYAYHWDMNPALRNSFIEKYHLHNLSDSLSVTLTAKPAGKDVYQFTVTLTNTSATPFNILDRNIYIGDMLYFRHAASQSVHTASNGTEYRDSASSGGDNEVGDFARQFSTVRYRARRPDWILLKPGETHVFRIEAKCQSVADLEWQPSELSKDAEIVLGTKDIFYDIRKPGSYRVRALFEQRKLTPEQQNHEKIDNPWVGRVVSNAVEVQIQ